MVPALFSSLFLPVAILFLKSHSNSTETHRVPDERVLGRAVKLQALFQNVYSCFLPFPWCRISFLFYFPFFLFLFLLLFFGKSRERRPAVFRGTSCHANSESKSTWPTGATSWSTDGKSRLQIEHKGA